MPRAVKCLAASARGSFKALTLIRHKGMKGLRFYQWQRSDQELEMKVGVIFIRFIFWKFAFCDDDANSIFAIFQLCHYLSVWFTKC